jgi:hypothetical protein
MSRLITRLWLAVVALALIQSQANCAACHVLYAIRKRK